MVRCERSETDNELNIGRGLVNGLLSAIPLWVIVGIGVAAVFQHGPMDETFSAVLMIAAVCEAILVRPYAQTLWARILCYADLYRSASRREASRRQARPVQRVLGVRGRVDSDLEKLTGQRFHSIEDLLRYVEPKSALPQQTRRAVAPNSLFRQSLALSALVGAYLQYYFIEINLQIASMNSLTVFLPVTSMT